MPWIAKVSECSDDQLAFSTKRCMDRCSQGQHWPPDLAEFISIAEEFSDNPLGLNAADVMNEYWRFIKHYWKYDSAETFPWTHPALYHICPQMRSEGARRNLSQADLSKMATRLLAKWIKHAEQGFSIPPICKKIDVPARAVGSTPAQQLAAGERYVK
ncbi:replication protein P [Rouxiella sp. T17]|uniref:replication protein P n=1 Tax=Rouxiella sp. T17 TaxID=3085684 RepID=UPI002FC83D1E